LNFLKPICYKFIVFQIQKMAAASEMPPKLHTLYTLKEIGLPLLFVGIPLEQLILKGVAKTLKELIREGVAKETVLENGSIVYLVPHFVGVRDIYENLYHKIPIEKLHDEVSKGEIFIPNGFGYDKVPSNCNKLYVPKSTSPLTGSGGYAGYQHDDSDYLFVESGAGFKGYLREHCRLLFHKRVYGGYNGLPPQYYF
jgi:hypothetical protein